MASLMICLMGEAGVANAGQRTCELVKRVCTSSLGTDKCLEYQSTYRCWTPSLEKDRCEPTSSGTLANCQKKAVNCSKKEGNDCLETTTSLTCAGRPVGEGITLEEPEIAVTYSTIEEGTLPQGCRITAETCEDSAPRNIAVENLPEKTVKAEPACWRKIKEVSCPSATAAKACQTLEAAGCVKVSDPVCVETKNGVCERWSVSYRCKGSEVKGEGIVVDDIIDRLSES